ncbi:hypothetical protein M8845_18625, partial [Gelidibacter japonicus]|uniref:hypothetical protein n=1 Tax=Gelidibacter japonicus TaxID=1962232 RepID=UPI0020219470
AQNQALLIASCCAMFPCVLIRFCLRSAFFSLFLSFTDHRKRKTAFDGFAFPMFDIPKSYSENVDKNPSNVFLLSRTLLD